MRLARLSAILRADGRAFFIGDAMSRQSILEDNQKRRDGRLPVRRLDEGEVTFKIPKKDMARLARKYPDLVAKDHTTRLAAWHKFRQTAEAEKYLVTRTPRQVRNSQGGIIVR